MKHLVDVEAFLQKILMAIAAFCLIAMLLVTCTDILIRQVWKPLPGTFELMGLFGALVVACALGYTQRRKDHIAVDILTNIYPKPLQKILEVLNCLACLAFSILAAWQVGKIAHTMQVTGEVTETLRMIYYPFTYGVATGFVLLAFVFFVELLKVFTPARQLEQEQ